MTHHLRVFVASPGDVSLEREMLCTVVDELNEEIDPPKDWSLEAVRWQTHAAPGAGRPQAVINEQIGGYDVFVGIMWRRFGTPTGVAASGTEEEYQIAYQKWQSNPGLVLMFYFCEAPFYPTTVDELEQMKRVLLFRQDLEGKGLAWKYGSSDEFAGDIRKHLRVRANRIVEERKKIARQHAMPNDRDVRMLMELWNRMSPDAQSAFNIAYNENRLAGDPGIQTRDLFAALQRVASPSIQPIISEIPSKALPGATVGPVRDTAYILAERPWLSHCVAASLHRLGKALPAGRKLNAADIFADIARNGTGGSVARLREHNIGPAEIERILARKGIQVVET